MASAVLRISADYLNGLSATVRRDTLRTSELELQAAEEKVRQARMAINSYRAATGSLDPAAAAMATSVGISSMQQQVIQLRADEAAQLAFNRPGSPQMAEIQARIAGLEQQIAVQQQKIANTKGSDTSPNGCAPSKACRSPTNTPTATSSPRWGPMTRPDPWPANGSASWSRPWRRIFPTNPPNLTG